MKIEDIEIHAGAPEFGYQPVRRLEAKCEATTNFSKAPTIDDVNNKLRELALSVGANAVVGVRYESGPTMTSWRSMRGFGLAVKRLSEDIPCPVCAETIKRAAKKCRFCGAEITESIQAQSAPMAAASTQTEPVAEQAPLKSSDNVPVILMVIVGIVLGLLMISGMQ